MRFVEQLVHDLRFGFRSLLKTPAFTGIAVLSLALGIMATTAIYSVVHGVVLDPFPYKDVDNLMSVLVRDPGSRGFGRTYYQIDQYLEIAERNTIFEDTVASTISDVVWTDGPEPQRLRGNHITPTTFDVMGVPALIGRTVTPSDVRPDAQPVAVLGYKFWQRQFGGDNGVLGKQLRLNGVVRTVIGVMPKRFMWRGADVYIPVVLERGKAVEGVRMVHLLGRLKPGVTEAQAQGDLTPIIDDLRKKAPAEFPEKYRVGLLSFKETFPSAIRDALWILFGAVGLLLLIACANVSNLLVSKATARQKEMAVRASLGADRWRLVRQLLTESLLLATVGGTLGIALAFVALKAIIAIVPPGTIPDESEIVINIPVLLFSAGISMLTALLFGLAPALHTCTSQLADPLKAATRGVSGGFRQGWLRNGLVVTEVALSIMLLVGASLMIRTVLAMENVNYGFQPDRVLTMRLPLADARYPTPDKRIAFIDAVIERIRAVPGIRTVAVSSSMHPLGGPSLPVEVTGSGINDSRPTMVHTASENYLQAFGIAVLQGRAYTSQEVRTKQRLAMVNEAFVRRYIGTSDVLGRIARLPRLRERPFNLTEDSFQIIGVVKDTVNRSWVGEISPEIYIPYTIVAMADRISIATERDPSTITNAVRAQVYALDSQQPVTEVRTVHDLLHEWVYAGPRFNLVLFSLFAGLGLTLAIVGVYGVISHSVTQQTQEIGVRIAIGASFGNVMMMVLSRGVKLLVAGLVFGLIGSLAAVRVLSSQVWQGATMDPVAFTAVAALLLAVGLAACIWPARRAATIDPIKALRYE